MKFGQVDISSGMESYYSDIENSGGGFTNNGNINVICGSNPSAISVSTGTTIASDLEIELKVSEVSAWFMGEGRDDDSRPHYAYAAMMLNGIISVSDIAELNYPENYPYAKVTYGYAKEIFEQIANKLGLEDEISIVGFMEELDSKDSTDYIDNFGTNNSFDKLFDDFIAALNDDI